MPLYCDENLNLKRNEILSACCKELQAEEY